ncbi:hypothetical protein PENTCL1PPCAC_8593 [Pristionchus entomophagus]|uniref:Uncharacterized protein n=1 Tax=Pristionchus entomophagus TaxID=358040 RepID=A0AAV5STE8_9BILA|nr:hypothetical protein PENTCL1PPCAC_8593 [Pristionchus entomophagus]
MSVNYTTVKWTEYETYGRKYELNVILAFTMRNWIYMLHQEDQEFKPTMHRIDTRTYELSRVDMECDDSFVEEFKKTEDHDAWSRKNADREPVVHEDAVHIFTRMTATLYRAFELDGVFYWRIVESTGDKPLSDEELEEYYYLISSQPQPESDEDNSPSLYRQLYYENDDDHLIVMYQLDISTMDWTKRETNTSDKGGMDAIEYIEDYRELRTEATRIVRKSLLVGSKWHVLLSYTEEGMTLSAHLILDLQSDDLNWETRLSYRGDYRGLDYLAEVDHKSFPVASTDRMFVSGEHTDTHRPMIYHRIFDINEIGPQASVEPSHAADHVEGGYQYVVTVDTRHFFIGALGSTQIGRQRIVKSRSVEINSDSTQFNQRPLQEAGLLERDRTYDAVFPVLISLNVDSDNEEERENDEWNY